MHLEYLVCGRPRVPTRVRVRTSVGNHPDVVEVEGVVEAAAAADDVDGAGGVDHGRVVCSDTPRRADGATSPSGTCGHAGDGL